MTTVEDVRNHALALVAQHAPNATAGQREALVERLFQRESVAETLKDESLRAVLLNPDIGLAPALANLLRCDPGLIKAVPSVGDVFAFESKIAGDGWSPEQRLARYREIERMSADERLATNAEAGLADKAQPPTQQQSTPGSKDFHNWKDDDSRFDDEIKRRFGQDTWALPPSRRAEYVHAFKRESNRPVLNPTQAYELRSLGEIDPSKMTAEQRVTLARLQERVKGAA